MYIMLNLTVIHSKIIPINNRCIGKYIKRSVEVYTLLTPPPPTTTTTAPTQKKQSLTILHERNRNKMKDIEFLNG